MDIIEKNPDNPWNQSSISHNPNITMDMIENNPDKPWDWRAIYCNLFTRYKEMFMARKYRQHLAAFKIHQYFTRAKYDPTYAYCRKLQN